MGVLTDIRNRGVKDTSFVVCDGLKGLPRWSPTCGPKARSRPRLHHPPDPQHLMRGMSAEEDLLGDGRKVGIPPCNIDGFESPIVWGRSDDAFGGHENVSPEPSYGTPSTITPPAALGRGQPSEPTAVVQARPAARVVYAFARLDLPGTDADKGGSRGYANGYWSAVTWGFTSERGVRTSN